MGDLRYVSLHNHTGMSLYDGLGWPSDFYQYVIASGGDGMAITEHGSMSSLGYAVTAANALKNKGVNFRPIYGVEAYVLPSLADWRKAYNDEDIENALVIEDENESKAKYYDPVKRRHHLVITALNNKGLENLFTLVSLSYRRECFYRFPRLDYQMLRQHSDGLAISTACLAGLPTWLSLFKEDASTQEVMQLYDKELLPLLEIFGKDRAFLELQFNALPQQRIVNDHLIEYHKRSGYKLIVASDAHYCKPELWREREIYKSLGRQMMKAGNDIAALPQSIEDLKCELYPHNADQIYGAYGKYFRDDAGTNDQIVKDAINRTHDIAWHLMGDVNPDSSIKLPRFDASVGRTPIQHLKDLCGKRLREKGLHNDRRYVERTIYELKIIQDKNIAEYFLTKKAILDALRKKLLLGVGRGSGAGSIVNYLLDITLADPIAGGLLFERFISPSRAELPDIDSDCEDKDQAYTILQETFGEDSVFAISNYNTLKLKSLVKDVSRLYSLPFDEVNQCTKVMESEAKDAIMAEIGNDQKLYEFTYARAYQHSPTFKAFIDQYPQVGDCLAVLYKSIKSIGRHAGGILIVPDAHKHMPIIRVRNVMQSPFTEGMTAQHLKLFGLVKFDVLGLTTLKIIRRCIELILKSWGVQDITTEDVWDFYNQNLHPDVINPADPHVFEHVYHEGRFPSIFQFAERGVQKFVQKAKPMNVTDLAAITSIYRPGALTAKGDERYVDATLNPPIYGHPILEEVLGETRSVLCFQEQFMKLANQLAGFSLDEADKLRKLLVKPSAELGQEMKQQRIKVGERFIAGCVEKGLTQQRAHDLWFSEVLSYISYGFNKSHAYVYAYNSYQCAWLYTKYEEQWIKSCLECDPDLERTIATVMQLGYEIVKPDINDSLTDEWQILNKRCVPPLTALKGIGMAAAEELVKTRQKPFESVEDFFWCKDDKGHNKWRWSKFNKRAIETLIKLEAFESLQCVGADAPFKNYKHMHSSVFGSFDKLRKGVIKEGRGKKATTTNLTVHDVIADECDDWQRTEKIAMQKELTGTFDKSLLFSATQMQMINTYNVPPYTVVNDDIPQPVWFFVDNLEIRKTKGGKDYQRLAISDGGGNSKTVNIFDNHDAVECGQLYFARLFMQDWFVNIEGRLHPIK